VVWGNEEYVAVGMGVWRSPDGLNWTSVNSPASEGLWRVSDGDGVYVVARSTGELWSSDDLESWIGVDLEADLRGLAYGPPGFVVTATEGRVWLWRPGGEWNDIGAITTGELGAVGYGNQGYVAWAMHHEEEAHIELLHSLEGVIWASSRLSEPNYFDANRIVFGDGVYLVNGWSGVVLLRREEGEWLSQPWTSWYWWSGGSLAYGPPGYVSLGWSGGWHSTDGLVWEKLGRLDLADITKVGDTWFVVHLAGDRFHETYYEIRSSSDLTTWTAESSGVFGGGGAYGLVSLGGIVGDVYGGTLRLRRPDGQWTTFTPTNDWPRDVAAANGQWILIGRRYDELLQQDQPVIYRSGDADTWESVALGFEGDLRRVVHAGDWFYTWGEEYGVGAILLVSENGLSWQRSPLGQQYEFRAITYGNGLYVALAYDYGDSQSVFLNSDNGLAWRVVTLVTRLGEVDLRFSDLEYGSGFFVASCRGYWLNIDREESVFFLSRDGVHWRKHGLPAYADLFDLPGRRVSQVASMFSDGRFYGAGPGGLLLQSQPLVRLGTPRRESDGQLAAVVEGEPGAEYPLQDSEDLLTWKTIGSIRLHGPAETVPLPMQPTPDHRRFYRVLVRTTEP
jgi:hypothetical protein